MKKKKEETKKLILNKITIAQLDNDQMNQVKGGTKDTFSGDSSPTTGSGSSCHCNTN